jgi:STAS domain
MVMSSFLSVGLDCLDLAALPNSSMSFALQNRLHFTMTTIVCDLRSVTSNAAALDALARLQLNARRLGLELRLQHASGELQKLIAFAGLDEVLRVELEG